MSRDHRAGCASSPSPTRRAASARPPPPSTSAPRWPPSASGCCSSTSTRRATPRPGSASPRGRARRTTLRRARWATASIAEAAVQDRGARPGHGAGRTPTSSGVEIGALAEANRAVPAARRRRGARWRSSAHARPGALQLRADRLPAVAQPADRQRHDGGRRGAGAAAVRVLRAGGPVPAQGDHRADRAAASTRGSRSRAWC